MITMSEKNYRLSQLPKFRQLFSGRSDAVFADYGNRVTRIQGRGIESGDWLNHLVIGKYSIGTYPYENEMTSWGCIDIDEDRLDIVASIRDVSLFLGLKPALETSRSKGYHIWYLFEGLLSAQIVREALVFVCSIADYDYKEINPKQISGDIIGNTVRLPYPASALPGRQTMFTYEGELISFRQWIQAPMVCERHAVQRIGVIGMTKDEPLSWVSDAELIASAYGAFKIGTTYNGVGMTQGDVWDVYIGTKLIEKGARDLKLFTLANLMFGLGLDKDDAMYVMQRVWKEQVLDKTDMRESDVLKKIDRVYSGGHKKKGQSNHAYSSWS
jgi:hypothetical protein